MSRSGYSEDYDGKGTPLEFYRKAVDNSAKGKRGQAFFTDLLAALDAMPDKRLIASELRDESGSVCAIGALAEARGVDVSGVDPEDARSVGRMFGIAESLAREVVFENDDNDLYYFSKTQTPEQRWLRMRTWVAAQIGPNRERLD